MIVTQSGEWQIYRHVLFCVNTLLCNAMRWVPSVAGVIGGVPAVIVAQIPPQSTCFHLTRETVDRNVALSLQGQRRSLLTAWSPRLRNAAAAKGSSRPPLPVIRSH